MFYLEPFVVYNIRNNNNNNYARTLEQLLLEIIIMIIIMMMMMMTTKEKNGRQYTYMYIFLKQNVYAIDDGTAIAKRN